MTPAEIRRVAAEAGVDPRTAKAVLAGEQVTSTCADAVARAAARLGFPMPAAGTRLAADGKRYRVDPEHPLRMMPGAVESFATAGAAAQAAVDKLTRPRVERAHGGCAVEVDACVGLDEDGFEAYVVDRDEAVSREPIRFCKRHALAAEALVTFAGIRGDVVPTLLRLLDGGS